MKIKKVIGLIVWVTVQIGIASLLIGSRLVPQVILAVLYLGFLLSLLFAAKTVDRQTVSSFKECRK